MTKFYLQYGYPQGEPRVFLDAELRPLSKEMEVIEAENWKEARDKVGPVPPPPKDGA